MAYTVDDCMALADYLEFGRMSKAYCTVRNSSKHTVVTALFIKEEFCTLTGERWSLILLKLSMIRDRSPLIECF